MARHPSASPRGRNPFDPLDGPVDEHLDLHGYRAVEARVVVADVLRAVQKRHPGGLLHIITGRGRGSVGGPVLKPIVQGVLSAAPSGMVHAWGKDDADGGFLVRLAGRR